MAFRIITDADYEGVGVAPPFSIEPSAEGMDPTDLQWKFEETVRTLAIPAYNELAEKLNDGRGAAEMVAIDPVTLMAVSMQGALEALKHYTDQKVVEIGAGDMAQSVYDPRGYAQDIFKYADEAGFDDYSHHKTGTVHSLEKEEGGENIRFVPIEDYLPGDTFEVNSRAVTAQTVNGKPLGTGYWKIGVTVAAFLNGDLLTFPAPSAPETSFVDDAEIQIGWYKTGTNAGGESIYKPHHRKIVTVPALPNTGTGTYYFSNFGMADLENLRLVSAAAVDVNGHGRLPLPFVSQTLADQISIMAITATSWQAWSGSNKSSYKGEFWWTYTKTTDSALTKEEIYAL